MCIKNVNRVKMEFTPPPPVKSRAFYFHQRTKLQLSSSGKWFLIQRGYTIIRLHKELLKNIYFKNVEWIWQPLWLICQRNL